MNTETAIKELKKYKDPEKKKIHQSFFKTGKGEYGEGDKFLGVTVPNTRKVAKTFKDLKLKDVKELLKNEIHEARLLGLLILVEKYEEAKKQKDEKENKKIVEFYLQNLKGINNWDLVDLSCYKILGDFLANKKQRKILYELAKSNNMWERRISIVSTMAFIKNNDLKDVYKLSKKLMKDKEDIIHKATGWMLREAGKKDENKLKAFLEKNIKQMPRVTLRYSIERFPETERKYFLNKPFKKTF